MIFRPELARQIRQNRKTQTRRPVKPGETKCRYLPGRVYQVQAGRGKPGLFPITILDVREERLDEITLTDVRREGFRTTREFFDAWLAIHGHIDPEIRVWVIWFALGDHLDQPRLLAARFSRGDYTSNPHLAANDEPEAVSEHQQARMSAEARERDHVAKRLPIHGPAERIAGELREMRRLAAETGLDDQHMAKGIRALERQLEALQRRIAA